MSLWYIGFSALNVVILKQVNQIVVEPYMDEPFHIPQVQAYCRGEWSAWDPKITTPPGLYILSIILKQLFMLKCTVPILRLTPMLTLLSLPIAIKYLLAFHNRVKPRRSPFDVPLEAVTIAAFPIAWFFGFLYYTDVPSLVSVLLTIILATQNQHVLAALLGLVSCMFRQTNIVWVFYAFAISQITRLRFQRSSPTSRWRDPPALESYPADLVQSLISFPTVLPSLIPPSLPYLFSLLAFITFIVWNGGIVLGDKSNHIPALHVPQLYYFIGFATVFGWPALVSYEAGPLTLIKDVRQRMLGSPRRITITAALQVAMAWTIYRYTIHHPFLLSDNRHYTFYIWKRVFRLHPIMPYLFAPGYLACAWAWFLRIGKDQSLLQMLVLPLALLPTLLPTPLLEPRYFIAPYILLRAQVTDMPTWTTVLEAAWYTAINAITMYVFLHAERPGVGRFMW